MRNTSEMLKKQSPCGVINFYSHHYDGYNALGYIDCMYKVMFLYT
jgi:hypothetical protein